jgi:hypothetical protein
MGHVDTVMVGDDDTVMFGVGDKGNDSLGGKQCKCSAEEAHRDKSLRLLVEQHERSVKVY